MACSQLQCLSVNNIEICRSTLDKTNLLSKLVHSPTTSSNGLGGSTPSTTSIGAGGSGILPVLRSGRSAGVVEASVGLLLLGWVLAASGTMAHLTTVATLNLGPVLRLWTVLGHVADLVAVAASHRITRLWALARNVSWIKSALYTV